MATRVQLLPEVIDVSFVMTLSGGGGLLATLIAAALRFDADRLARLVMFGNLVGGGLGAAVLLLVAAGVR